MALVTWEVDSEDSDADIESGDSPEEQAIKHATNIAEEYFGGDTSWTFIVELDSGQRFSVNVDSGEVEDVSDEYHEEAEIHPQSMN